MGLEQGEGWYPCGQHILHPWHALPQLRGCGARAQPCFPSRWPRQGLLRDRRAQGSSRGASALRPPWDGRSVRVVLPNPGPSGTGQSWPGDAAGREESRRATLAEGNDLLALVVSIARGPVAAPHNPP